METEIHKISLVYVYVYPVMVRIWRRGDHFYAVVTDPASIETLMPHTGKYVAIELAGLEFTAMLRKLPQKLLYVGVELPSRLNLTWAKMWAQEKSRKMLIKIIGDGKPAPEEPKLGGAA
jgi:hypothetical protein